MHGTTPTRFDLWRVAGKERSSLTSVRNGVGCKGVSRYRHYLLSPFWTLGADSGNPTGGKGESGDRREGFITGFLHDRWITGSLPFYYGLKLPECQWPAGSCPGMPIFVPWFQMVAAADQPAVEIAHSYGGGSGRDHSMKKFLLVVVAALLIMASGILLLVWWVSLEDYREVIEARVERATGYPLTIGGEMSLTLWPRLGIVLEETELGNPPGFPAGEPLLKIRSLRVSIPVAPLFEHRLVLEDAVMEGVEAHLVRNREGVGNWEALIAGGGKPDHPPAGQRGAGSDLSDRLEMDVAAIELRDARLTFRDRQAGTFREIAGVDLRLSELDPEHGGRLTLEAGVRLEEGAAEVPLAVEAVMGWNLQEGRFRLEPLRLSLGDLRLSGRLESEQQEGQPRYRIRMASEPFRPIDLLRDLLPETEGLPKGVLGRESRLSLQVDGTPKALRIETLELNSGDLTVRGRLEVAGLESGEPHFSGKLKGAPFDLRRLLAEAGLHLDDILSPGRLTRASLSMRMKGDMEHLEFPALLFRFDDSILRGEAAFRFREGQLPATSFRLGLDTLDLDAYLLSREPAGAAGEATDGKAAAPLLPVESLRNLAL
ncbi:MAG TPA: AsmA family protein, partial [Chloroflexi bacterium]|nr:AsmA family protein [Chloroflexota bacterium]